ncbi:MULTISPECIES: hypothetical protein [Enterobacteriaceae]|uniref:hypothetical protein n=1 Tax=Enterobacteriaceae TaxID=543 RepID=UPI00301BB90D
MADIAKVLKYVALAQKELASTVAVQGKKIDNHQKIIDSQGKDIAALEKQVIELRNAAIRAEIRSGERTDSVAQRYNLSPSRVSQIAPRSAK